MHIVYHGLQSNLQAAIFDGFEDVNILLPCKLYHSV